MVTVLGQPGIQIPILFYEFQLMLDNLNKSSGPLKTLTETWLVHSVSREDLARILEPLLLTLLGKGTFISDVTQA